MEKLETIMRKSMLYKTGVEYGDYTLNHILGCSHGCKYPCYAFMMKRRFGKVKSYEDWIKPKIVANTLELLDKEIPRLKGNIKSVQLCFTTDPFMYGYEEIATMSLDVIKKLNSAGIKCIVLTKGILPPELAELSPENEYGISLISLSESYREKIEPGAAPYFLRIEALKSLHKAGCTTWVSMEPYPTPNLINQELHNILDSIKFVKKMIFGRTNYNKEISSYPHYKDFYNACASQVIQFCKNNEISFHIKTGTITE